MQPRDNKSGKREIYSKMIYACAKYYSDAGAVQLRKL